MESFFLGFIAAIAALFLEIGLLALISGPDMDKGLAYLSMPILFILFSALIEEISKSIVIAKRVELFSLGSSYVFNSILVGVGFFFAELILSTSNGLASFSLANSSKLLIVHIGTSAIIGYVLSQAKPHSRTAFLRALLVAFILHAAFNLTSFRGSGLDVWISRAILSFLLFLVVLLPIRAHFKLARWLRFAYNLIGK